MIRLLPPFYLFLIGLVLGVALDWGLSELTRPEPPACLASDRSQPSPDSTIASRARYISASGPLAVAWGDWNIAFHDPSTSRYYVIVGIDTQERCEATRKILTEHFKGQAGAFADSIARCYETVGDGTK